MIPTRWRTLFEEQMADAGQRLDAADLQLAGGEGGRALQGAYQATVAAASVRVWLTDPPWKAMLPAGEMQRRVQAALPNLFAALVSLDLKDVLTSPWAPDAAAPYVKEARAFVTATADQLRKWLEEN
jgi:hypothetical protein